MVEVAVVVEPKRQEMLGGILINLSNAIQIFVTPGAHASAILLTSCINLRLVICVEPTLCSAFAISGECSSGL